MYSECLSEKIALVIIGKCFLFCFCLFFVCFFWGGGGVPTACLAKKTKTTSLGVEITVHILREHVKFDVRSDGDITSTWLPC